jgi:hypothetical protein
MNLSFLCHQKNSKEENIVPQSKKRRLYDEEELSAASQMLMFDFRFDIQPSAPKISIFAPSLQWMANSSTSAPFVCSPSGVPECSPLPFMCDEEETEDDELISESKEDEVQKPKRKRSKLSTFTDITHLLHLPQKEAAQKLGISESMLCKRFKEQTQRKWPFRTLRKLDRQIEKKQKAFFISSDEQKKIQQLKDERDLCLAPVQIRIKPSDIDLKIFKKDLNILQQAPFDPSESTSDD